MNGWDPGVPRLGREARAGGDRSPRQPEDPSDPTPSRAGTEKRALLSCPRLLRGPVLGRERGKERRGDWGNFPASLAHSINHRSRGGGRAGKCAEPERSVVAPDTSLSPHGFLSFFQFFFSKPPPLPPRSGGCPSLAAWSPLRLHWVPPAALAAAASASLRWDLGKRKLGGSRLALRLSAQRPRGPRPRVQAPQLFQTPAAPRGPRQVPETAPAAASSPARRRSRAMVAARAPAL